MYKPWRNENHIIGNSNPYKEEFFKVVENIPALKEVYMHKEQVRVLRGNIETAVNEVVKDKHDSEERDCADDSNDDLKVGLKEFDEVNNCKYLFNTETELNEFVSTLNVDQLRVYNKITCSLRHQLDHESGKCNIPNCNDNKTLLMYVSGYDGTGKSYLIKAILGYIKLQRKVHNEKCDYIVAAPTGLAAAGIGGETIHSVFNISVQHGNMPKYTSLSASAIDQMRAVMADLKCIMIDEISMVSNVLLLQIHLRLQDAFDKNMLFGGKNIVLFGDLLQLPPVNSNLPYAEIKGKDVSKITDGLKVSLNLWREFAYEELSINQRQSGDSNNAWRNLLHRTRLGILNQNDHKILLTRLVPLDIENISMHKPIAKAVDYFVKLIEKEPSAVCLLTTRNLEIWLTNLIELS